MRLTEAQSRELLHTHGVYVTEACDRCGQTLGHVRYTRRNEPGEWCSRASLTGCGALASPTIIFQVFIIGGQAERKVLT
jgi:hypothetical protein